MHMSIAPITLGKPEGEDSVIQRLVNLQPTLIYVDGTPPCPTVFESFVSVFDRFYGYVFHFCQLFCVSLVRVSS